MSEETQAPETQTTETPVDADFLVKASLLNEALNHLAKLPYRDVSKTVDAFFALRAVKVEQVKPPEPVAADDNEVEDFV